MACLDMYNSEHKGHHNHHCAPMSPRISFSNDFVDLQQAMKQQQERSTTRSEASASASASAVSSDFEFSVTNYSMMSADELFCKGRFLPYKDNNQVMQQRAPTTLREELLVDDDDEYGGFSLRPPKGSSTRWKGLLGLRKSHIGNSKKAEKSEGSSSDRRGEARRSALVNEGAPINMMTSQELFNEGGSSCSDLGSGI